MNPDGGHKNRQSKENDKENWNRSIQLAAGLVVDLVYSRSITV